MQLGMNKAAIERHLEQIRILEGDLAERDLVAKSHLEHIRTIEEELAEARRVTQAHLDHIRQLEAEVSRGQHTAAAQVEHAMLLEQELTRTRESFQQHATVLDRELEATRGTVAAQLEHIRRLEHQVDEGRRTAAAQLEHIRTLEGDVDEGRKAVAAQIEHIRTLEGEVDDGRRTIAAHLQHIRTLQSEIQELRSSLDKQAIRVDALLEERARSTSEADRLRATNEVLTAGIVGRLSLLQYTLQEQVRAGPRDAGARPSEASAREVRRLYLDLLEGSLTGTLFDDAPISPWSSGFDENVRLIGRDWPSRAQTMIGTVRMRNIRHLAETVLDESIPGDFIETGVWRGGACIYLRGILAAYGCSDRTVWVADSFCGLPPPDTEHYPADEGDRHHEVQELAVSADEVRRNFERYGLLDAQVSFLEGWFKDTLPTAPVEKLALIRLDGDMYESTIQALDALYHKLSTGGFVIVDDYILEPCRIAVDEFRASHRIAATLEPVDGAAVFWRKEA